MDGKPLGGALVIFHPRDDRSPQATRSYAKTEPDGSFALSTYSPGDGAPAGHYIVTVLVQDVDEAEGMLPGHLGLPQTSGLMAEVKSQANELPPFRLRRK
jgi:hypothetical protein